MLKTKRKILRIGSWALIIILLPFGALLGKLRGLRAAGTKWMTVLKWALGLDKSMLRER